MSRDDALHAVDNAIYESYLDDGSPARRLILGLDSRGTVLELVLLVSDSGNELVVHAVPGCEQYLKLLSR